MGFRTPAPDGRKGMDGLPILVLPEDTLLKECYTVCYLTVGGMSVVYRGTWQGTTYFIKEVDSLDPRKIVSLSQEKATLERLEHPGIIKVYDFFEQEGFYYLVLEFVQGTSLERLVSPMANVYLQEKVVMDWALQLYDIFEYLHRQNPPIIYRDLKPQNIMKDARGRIRLVDFGIARVYKDSRGGDTEMMGSAITASPEHYGSKQTDARSDIFTIGATLNYLLTNGHGRGDEVFEFHPVRDVNSKVTEKTEKLIRKALEIDPNNRFQSIREMREAQLASSDAAGASGERYRSGDLNTDGAKKLIEPEDAAGRRAGAPSSAKALPPMAGVLALALFLIVAGVLIIRNIFLPHIGKDSRTGLAATAAASSPLPSAITADRVSPSPSATPPDKVPVPLTSIFPTLAVIAEPSPSSRPASSLKPPGHLAPTGRTPNPTETFQSGTMAPASRSPEHVPSPAEVTPREPAKTALKKEEYLAHLMQRKVDDFSPIAGTQSGEGIRCFSDKGDSFLVPAGYLQIHDSLDYFNVIFGGDAESIRKISVKSCTLTLKKEDEREKEFDDAVEMKHELISRMRADGLIKREITFKGLNGWRIDYICYDFDAGRKFTYREIYLLNGSKTRYVQLQVSADPDIFQKFESEFSLFFASFAFAN
jgi:serine/threonine protein kinase